VESSGVDGKFGPKTQEKIIALYKIVPAPAPAPAEGGGKKILNPENGITVI
jgi:hypothetical protein